MHSAASPGLTNTFQQQPEACASIETPHRRIHTSLPAPTTLATLKRAYELTPQVNCYQPPIVWDRAEGYQVFDNAGNCWIDFSSTAVTTNTGHGHPAIRAALKQHAESGLLAQFSFASDIRTELAQRLIELAPAGCKKVYFWTVGSEAVECSFRLAREHGIRQHPEKFHILTHQGDYHGWTFAAHQLSGQSSQKPWLTQPDTAIHHLRFPADVGNSSTRTAEEWDAFLQQSLAEVFHDDLGPEHVAAIFIETLQGWGALAFPPLYLQQLRRWADAHGVLLIFDEVQTAFGRTGKWFAHEHYAVRADLLCIGKGLTSGLPLAAVLGPAEILDLLAPGEVTTTHAAHPLSCAAALANLRVLEDEGLITAAARKGELARSELDKLQQRFPQHISAIHGLGLLHAVHLQNAQTGEPSRQLARELTWAAVKRGVMLFYTNQPTIKCCPPLTIPDEALLEGIEAIGTALEAIVSKR